MCFPASATTFFAVFPGQRYYFFCQQFQGTVELGQAEQIGYAQQDHKQRVVEPVDDFFVRNSV